MNNNISGASIFLLALFTIHCGSATTTTPNGNPATSSNQTSPALPASPKPCAAPSPEENRTLVITAPCSGEQVSPRHFVEGTVSDPSTHVFVVIHPMENSDFWVQPTVTVREGGKWKVLCYFGEPGSQHSGKRYEVMAIINPKETLREGQLLPNWPEGQSRSQPVEVVRQ